MSTMQDEKTGKLSVEITPEKNAKKDKDSKFWKVNKDMLPYKLHFLLFVGGMGAVLPYQSAYGINRLGLTASNIAAAYTAQQFLFILLKPGIGYLADYFNRLKATIIGLTILQAIFCFLMIIIPRVDVQNILNGYDQQLYISSSELNHCHVCSNYLEFKTISSTLPYDQGILQNMMNCLNNSQNDVVQANVQCLSENANSSYSFNVDYKLVYRTCNDSSGNKIASSVNASMLSSLNESNLFYVTMSLNESETIHMICIQIIKSEFNFIESDISLNLLTNHCYFVPESDSVFLQATLNDHFISKQNVSCGNSKLYYSPDRKDNNNSVLSSEIFKTYQFWLFSLCLISSCTCISCVFTMSDTACHESSHKTGCDYGRTRAMGAMSWGLIAPFAGFLNDYTDSYMASWGLMVVMCSLQIWNLSKMDLIKPDFSQSILKDMKIVFSSIEFIAFEIGVFMNGMCTGVIWFYLTWFLISIGGNKLLIGLANTVQCYCGEVPFMFYSTWMIKKLGHFNIVSLAIFAHGIRFFIYSYLHNPWWILPVEVLHGFTFGSFYSAMTSYAKLNSKPGTEATTQSILCTTYEATGAGLGCIIIGICFDRFGGEKTFFYAAFFCALATGVNVLFTVLLKCRKGALEVTKSNSERY